jgi:hypothetical protein
MYASAVCSGKVTPGGKKKNKKAGGGMIKPMYGSGGQVAGLARKRRIGCA